MPGFEQLAGFLLAAVLITASPGPDNLLVLGMGLSQGRRQGIAFGLGCAMGCLWHTLLAVAGVSVLLAASPLAFALLQLAGGAYLIWLGVQALRSRGGARAAADVGAGASLNRLFWRGVLANAINPKVALFFLSFLPQFVVGGHGAVPLQMAVLGAVFTAQAALLFGLLGYFAGRLGGVLERSPRIGLWLDRIAGGVFIALGLRLMLMVAH
ncbi:LysE family translocator [Amphibiibacter pelophylacis]|uniref:LysE family translocator n=1 Tax=Amphibiibacter pelophylacis TaxID=1799477 RepID=A0ACC6P4H9_9BURK